MLFHSEGMVNMELKFLIQDLSRFNTDGSHVHKFTKFKTNLNADAVVNIRYTTSTVMQGAAEILVYGTAVKFV
jgi:hypothetical protein